MREPTSAQMLPAVRGREALPEGAIGHRYPPMRTKYNIASLVLGQAPSGRGGEWR